MTNDTSRDAMMHVYLHNVSTFGRTLQVGVASLAKWLNPGGDHCILTKTLYLDLLKFDGIQ